MFDEAYYSGHYGLNTETMSSSSNRSEAVIEDYKKRKLAHSAVRRIEALLQGFDRERAFDRKLARAGVVIVVLLIAASFYWLVNADSLIVR